MICIRIVQSSSSQTPIPCTSNVDRQCNWHYQRRVRTSVGKH
ncbi:hypothetical protein AAZX31_08G183500 [Glycine max]